MSPIPLSSKEAAKLGIGKKRSKYGAVKTVVDGLKFDSRKEAQRWSELLLLQKSGAISGLLRQVPYPFYYPVDPRLGPKVFTYIADFVYDTADGKVIVEDVKSAMTRKLPLYRLKKKLIEAQWKFEITEV